MSFRRFTAILIAGLTVWTVFLSVLELKFGADSSLLFHITMAICAMLYGSAFQINKSVLLYIFSFVVCLLSFATLTSYYWDAFRIPTGNMYMTTIESALSQWVCIFIFSIPVTLLFHKQLDWLIRHRNQNRQWIFMTFPCVLISIGNALLVPRDYALFHIGSTFQVSLFVMATLFFLFILIQMNYYIIARENYDKNMAEHSRQMLNMQLHQQKLQNDYIEQTHHFRHDIKHHALILLSLMKQENYDEARDYLEKYTDYMDSAYTPVDVCKLPALNALINEYIKKTKELSIHFQYRVSISPYININEPELCIIVGNLLENALCACRDVPEEERYIKFFIDTEGSSQLYILIQNSFNGSLIWRNNEDIRIPEGHYGISSVRAIAKEHRGIAKFHTNANHFFAEVMLQIEKP